MHTFRKLPTIRPRMANRNINSISTGVYCGHITGLKSILNPVKSELLNPVKSELLPCVDSSYIIIINY